MSARPTRSQTIFFAGAVVLTPLLVLYASQVVWLQNAGEALGWMAGHGAAAGLFWLLFSVVSLTLYGFCRRLWLSYLPGTIVTMFLTLVSWYKYDINGAPLELSDAGFLGGWETLPGTQLPSLCPPAGP
ncbi:MAG: hypothetical protein SOR61_09180 [Evtepia sp.]|uniref:hypothetical protein n=1 Tax=Evtepia sp. TaxID=2773933 RepID=UPI002A7653F9|nr:hypothetical protein [Evtepia sp.]MDY3015324.1 hypothetical protein [Evtepia sp.]